MAEAATHRNAPLPYKFIVALWPAILTVCLGLISGFTDYLGEFLSLLLIREPISLYVSVPQIALWALTAGIVCAARRIRHRTLDDSWTIVLVVGLPINALSNLLT